MQFGEELKRNPLRTRQDVVQAAISLIDAASQCLTEGKSRLHIADSAAYYPEGVAGMEGWSRVLWAIVPMLVGHCPEVEKYWVLWREGLINGTDPQHPEYWGTLTGCDQRMVEMAVMGMALCLIPERFYEELTPAQQENLYQWLNQINRFGMPENNWRFFRVLVNEGFRRVGRPVDEARLAEDFALIESHYMRDGWYADKATQHDYYTLWAFHYYGLVYAVAAQEHDPVRCERYRERARQMAPRFACWFDDRGRALPYGRSLIYRFAQGCFWSAMALAGETTEVLQWGEIKGLLLRHLRFWFQQPIFDRDGVLTVGYGYPNLIVSESYNSPGSPYWAMKVFAMLALPESHPFWQAEEKPLSLPERFLDEPANLLLTRTQDGGMVTAYTAGNHAYEHCHEDEKYEKFAYSTHFAFSVAKEATSLWRGGYDSMLAVRSGEKDLWHGRSGCTQYSLTEKRVSFTWTPAQGIQVETVLIPLDGQWHLRRHRITAEHPFEAAEGAFSVRRDWVEERLCDVGYVQTEQDEHHAYAHGQYGSCAIFALKGYEKAEVIWGEGNTNLMAPRTVTPTLLTTLPTGVTELCCAVWCAEGDEALPEIPEALRKLADEGSC